jgi:hypothetical protein
MLPANERRDAVGSRGAEEARSSNIQHVVNIKFV